MVTFEVVPVLLLGTLAGWAADRLGATAPG
jgi:hypothetical protein